MTEPELQFVQCPDAHGGHRMAYWSWGDVTASHVVVCAHGLSRQGRDFDVLARALCARATAPIRVVCPDVVGRGKSDWLKDPMGYQIPAYAGDMLALLAVLKPATLDWVGTSMGGLIGMVLCGQPGLPLPVPVRRLVLNDVGPSIHWQAIVRIGTYLGKAGRFESLEQAAAAMLAISKTFGPHTPAQWLELSRHMVKPAEGAADMPGALALHYDPAIAVPVRAMTEEVAAQGEAVVWQLYDNIRATTLLLRGADSDLLTPATAAAMTQRGPRAHLVEFAGIGHAPTLIADDQVDCVTHFLLDRQS
jgi:pimeloyl-ACP methyl ester carboxylesterase